MDQCKWMLIYSKPRAELKLASRLIDAGVEVCCPTLKTIRQWGDRKKKVTEPLFKSYVLRKISPEQFNIVYSFSGFSRFVYWLGKPVVVRDDEIDNTNKFLDNFVHNTILVKEITRGQNVQVNTGALRGRNGQVIRIGKSKALLHIEALGTLVEAELALSELE